MVFSSGGPGRDRNWTGVGPGVSGEHDPGHHGVKTSRAIAERLIEHLQGSDPRIAITTGKIAVERPWSNSTPFSMALSQVMRKRSAQCGAQLDRRGGLKLQNPDLDSSRERSSTFVTSLVRRSVSELAMARNPGFLSFAETDRRRSWSVYT